MFVGRQSELAFLAERLGNVRPVAVLGEAGVGKTTLVRAAAAEAGRGLIEAGALGTLSWLPYLPLQRAFGHGFDADAAYVAQTIEAEIADALLFLDDLQWADAHTCALLPLLAGRVPLLVGIRRGDTGTPAALETIGAAGVELLPLEPFAGAEAAELARSLHPGLPEAAIRRLVERSGGNPFLLGQLAATGEASVSLRLAVAARLRALSEAGRDAIVALALLGRPAAPQLLGPGAGEIVDAALATANGEVAIRHALLAEATTEALTDSERRTVHSRLAAALEDAGEAARHHAAAGERELAREKALLAAGRASTPGERAAHLAVAAGNAEAEEEESLCVLAASALAEVGQYDAAERLLAQVRPRDQILRAESALTRSQARAAAGDVGAALAALAEGEGAAEGSELEVRLAVQRVRLELDANRDPPGSLERALAALELARALGRYEAEALHIVGQAKQAANRDDWPADLRGAMTAARAAADVGLECRVAESLGSMLFGAARAAAGRRVLIEMADRARTLHLIGWERRYRARVGWIDWHAGEFRRSAEEGEALLLEALEPWERFLVTYSTAQASIDLGRHERASVLIAELTRLVAGEQHERQRLWTLADAAFWAGRPREAIVFAEEALARFPHEKSTFAHLTRAWAHVDLGLDPGEPRVVPLAPLLAGAGLELQGTFELVEGRHREAAAYFLEAAGHWADRHVRGELRCLWAGGEALRRAEATDEAVERLLLAEDRAAFHDHAPLLGRIQRSLRLIGVRRSAERSTTAGGLTGREREVLDLVAAGLSNDEISRRLGLGQPTVVRLIRSAQRKLGAGSRMQAAALALLL